MVGPYFGGLGRLSRRIVRLVELTASFGPIERGSVLNSKCRVAGWGGGLRMLSNDLAKLSGRLPGQRPVDDENTGCIRHEARRQGRGQG